MSWVIGVVAYLPTNILYSYELFNIQTDDLLYKFDTITVFEALRSCKVVWKGWSINFWLKWIFSLLFKREWKNILSVNLLSRFCSSHYEGVVPGKELSFDVNLLFKMKPKVFLSTSHKSWDVAKIPPTPEHNFNRNCQIDSRSWFTMTLNAEMSYLK